MASHRKKTFVLVHDAWHGGWCWKEVAEILRRKGHEVTTPTLTGLGERGHLATRRIEFLTYLLDIKNHLAYEKLRNVVLVGHGFGGAVCSMVVDNMPQDIERLIFFDPMLPVSGKTILDTLPPDAKKDLMRPFRDSNDNAFIPYPMPEMLGVSEEIHRDAIRYRLSSQPYQPFLKVLELYSQIGNGRPCDLILSTKPTYPLSEGTAERAAAMGWPVHFLAAGHDAMITEPRMLAARLEQISLKRQLDPAWEDETSEEPDLIGRS